MLVSISVKILLNKLDKRVQFDMRKVKSIKFTQNGKSYSRSIGQAIKQSKCRNFAIFLSGSEWKLVAQILSIIFFNYNLQMKKKLKEIGSDNPETFPC